MQAPMALWVTCHVWYYKFHTRDVVTAGYKCYLSSIEWITDMQFELFQLLDLPTADLYNVKSALHLLP